MKATKKIKEWTNNLVNAVTVEPTQKTHAWVYNDDEEDNCYVTFHEHVNEDHDDQEGTLSNSETTDDENINDDTVVYESNDEFQDCNITSEESSPEATVSRHLRPDDIDEVQLQNVQRLDHILEDARAFLAVHPRPPYTRPKRNVSQPNNYSEFSRTGKK